MKPIKISLTIIALCSILLSCTDTSFLDIPGPDENGKESIIRIDGFNYLSSVGDRLDSEIFAEHALVFENKDRIELEVVIVRFYDEEGKTTVIHAQKGVIDLSTQNMNMTGNVKYVSPEQVVLQTDSIRWDRIKEELATNDDFVLERPLDGGNMTRTTGRGLTTDRFFKKWTFHNGGEIINYTIPR